MKYYYTDEQLTLISQDNQSLLEEIEKSHSYVLHLLESKNISYDTQFVLNNLSFFSWLHFKNKSEFSDNSIINNFLDNFFLSKEKLYLKNNSKIKSTVDSFDEFYTEESLLNNINDLDKDILENTYSKNPQLFTNAYLINLLNNYHKKFNFTILSFFMSVISKNKLSLDELKNLNIECFSKCNFPIHDHLWNGESINEVKKFVLDVVEYKINKKYTLSSDDYFKNFPFDFSDKNKCFNYLKFKHFLGDSATFYKNNNSLQKIMSFDELLILNDNKSLISFNKKQILENLKFIQDFYLYPTTTFDDLKNLNIDDDKFNLIFTDDFIKLLLNHPNYEFYKLDNFFYEDAMNKKFYNKLFNIILKEPQYLHKVNYEKFVDKFIFDINVNFLNGSLTNFEEYESLINELYHTNFVFSKTNFNNLNDLILTKFSEIKKNPNFYYLTNQHLEAINNSKLINSNNPNYNFKNINNEFFNHVLNDEQKIKFIINFNNTEFIFNNNIKLKDSNIIQLFKLDKDYFSSELSEWIINEKKETILVKIREFLNEYLNQFSYDENFDIFTFSYNDKLTYLDNKKNQLIKYFHDKFVNQLTETSSEILINFFSNYNIFYEENPKILENTINNFINNNEPLKALYFWNGIKKNFYTDVELYDKLDNYLSNLKNMNFQSIEKCLTNPLFYDFVIGLFEKNKFSLNSNFLFKNFSKEETERFSYLFIENLNKYKKENDIYIKNLDLLSFIIHNSLSEGLEKILFHDFFDEFTDNFVLFNNKNKFIVSEQFFDKCIDKIFNKDESQYFKRIDKIFQPDSKIFFNVVNESVDSHSKFFNLLKKYKKNPIVYVALATSDNFSTILGQNHYTNEHIDFFNKHIDYDIYLDGISQFKNVFQGQSFLSFDSFTNNENKINFLLMQSYYSTFNYSNNTKNVEGKISENLENKIFLTILENYPSFVFKNNIKLGSTRFHELLLKLYNNPIVENTIHYNTNNVVNSDTLIAYNKYYNHLVNESIANKNYNLLNYLTYIDKNKSLFNQEIKNYKKISLILNKAIHQKLPVFYNFDINFPIQKIQSYFSYIKINNKLSIKENKLNKI